MRPTARATAYVIGPFGAGNRATGPAAFPYGAEHLAAHGYDVTYTDPTASAASRVLRALCRLVHRFTATPVLEPVLEPARLARADLLVCVLEDNLAVLAPFVRLARRGRTSVLLTVWLAGELDTLTPRRRRRWRRRLAAFDHVLVFSANQVTLLRDKLGLPDGLVHVVPFGVAPLVPSDGPVSGVLTVGSDRGRDFATFVSALRDLPGTVTVVTNTQHRKALGDVAPVTVLGPVPRDEYLDLLRGARIVVSPTLSLDYPTGQTALLEAMQLGKPCVVTESAALRDYVTDGVDVLLVPERDPRALRVAVEKLAADDGLRSSLGAEAARTAARFTEAAMWSAVVTVVGARP